MYYMEKTPRMILAALTCAGIITGCSKSGERVTVEDNTTCWQCPGGEKLSRLQSINNCANGQVKWGDVAKGTMGTVEAPDDGTFPDKYGFTRVKVENIHGQNPLTLEEVDLGQRVCWIKSSDLKR
jgi:hypothetical protein